MSGRCLRQRPLVSYYEPDEPSLDEYVYCDRCGDLVYEYCSIHGPLLVVPDDKVPIKPNVPSYVPRAALTIPNVFLHLAPSSIPGLTGLVLSYDDTSMSLPRQYVSAMGRYLERFLPRRLCPNDYIYTDAGLGVFSTLTLPAGVRFGPYTGERTDDVDSNYCWQIYDSNRKPSYCIDASNASISNWMRYVNCSRHWSEQNLVAFQYQRQLYYRTVKIIPRCTELLVFYGSEFANELDIDLGKYNSPIYARVYNVADKKRKLNDEDPKLTQELITREPILQDIDNINENRNKSVEKRYINNNSIVEAFMTENNTEQDGGISEHLNNKTEKNEKNKEIPLGSRVDSLQTNFFYHFCDTCNEKFLIKNDLEKHMRFHDKNRIYDCNLCTYKFTCTETLTNHKFSKHQINYPNLKMHACEICEKTFRKITVLKEHLRTHTGEKPFVCGTCNAQLANKSSLRRHIRTHTGEKPFDCGTCNAQFAGKSDLRRHIRTHTGEKPFVCGTCNAQFAVKSNLQRHIRSHTGEKPFVCGTCNAQFTEKSSLRRHIRTHTGEKPFACGTCNAQFTEKSSLRRHIRTHTGEKPFVCGTCNAQFAGKSSLRRHIRTHTGEKSYSCGTCNTKFFDRSLLKIHSRTHTPEKPFSCSMCDSKFTRNQNLKKHMKTHTK